MKKYHFIIISFVLMLLCLIMPFTPVRADSGWDSDYDSGGSDWSSSSYDSDYDSDYDGSGSSSPGFVIFVIIIIVIIVIASSSNKTGTTKTYSIKSNIGDYDAKVNEYFPGYTEKMLLDVLYNIFVNIQKAWMNFDYESLERLCTDELYESYRSDLEVLKLKNGQNVMFGFKLVDYNINSIEKVKNQIVVHMGLTVSFHDYVIDTNTNKVTRGNKNTVMTNNYLLDFVIDEDQTSIDICPNCGAKLTGNDCEYCHSHVEVKHRHFVLSRKTRR